MIDDEVQELIDDLVDNYSNWRQGEYYIENKRTGFKIWTSGIVLDIDTYPHTNAFNLVEKYYIKRAIKKSNMLRAFPRDDGKDSKKKLEKPKREKKKFKLFSDK